MVALSRLLLAFAFLATLAISERSLPAELQVDLLFPRNDTTYAPTQWFPVVFGVKNLDAVWPLDISLSITITDHQFRANNGGPDWQYQHGSVTFSDVFNSISPGEYFFHIPTFNMTNGTTSSYTVAWDLNLWYRCSESTTDKKADEPGDGWSNNPNGYRGRFIEFHTAPGAKLPDIEATVNSCTDTNPETSTAVRVTKVGETHWKYPAEPCPWLEIDLTPSKCAFKPAIKEMAANVSAAVLSKMGCEEGAWQTQTTPCAKESNSSARRLGLFGLGCFLALPLALIHVL